MFLKNSAVMLSCSEDLLFVSRGKEILSKKSVVVGLKILVSKTGCIIRQVSFLKGAQAIFQENKELHYSL